MDFLNKIRQLPPFLSLAYGLRIGNGFSLGLYLLIYLALIGDIGESLFDSIDNPVLSSNIIGLLFVLLIYLACFFLEVWAGAVGDKFGTRIAMMFSYLSKALFFSGLFIVVLFRSSSTLFILGSVLSILSMALHYTLFSGNFETFLLTLTKKPKEIEKTFGKSLALKHIATVFGATVSLLSLSVYVENDIPSPNWKASLPFILGFVICIIFSVLAWIKLPQVFHQKNNLGAEGRKNLQEIRRLAHEKLWKGGVFKNLRGLYITNASIYGLLQSISVIIPLWIICGDYTIGQEFWILVFAQYLPAIVGSLAAVLEGKKKEKTLDQGHVLIAQSIRNLTMLFSLIVVIFAICGIFAKDNIILLMALVACARGIYAKIQPKIEFLTADFASKYAPDEKTALVSINRKWEKTGAIVCTILSILIQCLGKDKGHSMLLYSLFAIAICSFFIPMVGIRLKNWQA